VIVDTNIHLSRWPFRRLAGDETSDLVAKLRKRNVTQVWAGSFDGILHKDIGGVNARLASACRAHGKDLLVPFGSINPKLPGWQEDLRRCVQDYRMPGIRLHPNYHGYELKDPVFAELLHVASAHGLIVQLVVSMEDIRTQHPLMRMPPVDVSALPHLIKGEPSVRLVLLNWWPALRVQRLQPLAEAGAVYFEIATVEGIEGIARLVERLSAERVLFGSNFPLFYFEAALLKMQESGLSEELKRSLFEANARRILSLAARGGQLP
jgi:predicted TIM-barrel fold metal-dependent hydrolase